MYVGAVNILLKGRTSSISYALIPHRTRLKYLLQWGWRITVRCPHSETQSVEPLSDRLWWYSLENQWSPCQHCFEFFVQMEANVVLKDLWRTRPSHVTAEEWDKDIWPRASAFHSIIHKTDCQ